MRSRELYIDCLKARDLLAKAIADGKIDEAKIYWFACLAMLRAIGHVIYNVDSKNRTDDFRLELKKRYKRWKTESTFCDFIEKERNNILKEYESSLTKTAREECFSLVTESGDRLVTESGNPLVGVSVISEIVKTKGAFVGTSPVDLVTQALKWWDTELSDLEKIA